MTRPDPLRPGRITHQRKLADGTWEETPGWLSVDEHGTIVLSELTEEEAEIADQFSDCFGREGKWADS